MLSRVLFGMRLSLLAALGAMAIGAVIGVPGGLLAGYLGGWTDTLSSRVVDAIMAIPGLIFALTVIAVLGPGLGNVMLAIGLLLIPTFFRVTRASVLDVRHNVYVEASVAIGCPTWRVTLAHVLPNAAPPILVQATLSFAIAVIAEAGLSFLGLGARPPAASLGRLLAEATGRMDVAHLLYVPGVAILLMVASATLLGDVLRDMASERDRT
jgi:ABC-type dipeptide/oligopeptide/nickel transport system permease subunit